MKCRYRFQVRGRVRPSHNVPIICRGWTFEFETAQGLISHISVTTDLPNREHWPSTHDPSPDVKAHFQAKTPHLPSIQRELRAIQGLMAPFGLEAIDRRNIDVEWIPESPDERAALPLLKFSIRDEPLSSDQANILSFEVYARSVLAAEASAAVEVPMNFFRHGVLDIHERNYIEAIYDFYFVIETLYSGGKFRTGALLKALLSSDELRGCVAEALGDSPLPQPLDPQVRTEFGRIYGQATVESAIRRIVKLRGNLHHHTLKRKGIWHPDEQAPYKCDAMFLHMVALNVVLKLWEAHTYTPDVLQAYEDMARRRPDPT